MMRISTLVILCMLHSGRLGDATEFGANAVRQVAGNDSATCSAVADWEFTDVDIRRASSYPVVPCAPSDRCIHEKCLTSHLAFPAVGNEVFAETLLVTHNQVVSSYQKSWLLSKGLNYMLDRMSQAEQRTLSLLLALEASVSLSVRQAARNRLQVSSELRNIVKISKNAAKRDQILDLVERSLVEGPLKFVKDFIRRYWEHFVNCLYEALE
ncbi:hypothetical protein BIW11_05423 [Tropilaelaps mercedesae]|uniref:Secreted protein n=1 Tax=Tropilaelaps mercedesae TaxID=418985 RepID=A0A1V9Y2C5_9ACAR|nr:hypothetical protein BIW11_05423 [Tropilaelaps mercedesae]